MLFNLCLLMFAVSLLTLARTLLRPRRRRAATPAPPIDDADSFLEIRYKVPIAAVSTHRPKPKAETDAQGDPTTAIRQTSARNYYGDGKAAP